MCTLVVAGTKTNRHVKAQKKNWCDSGVWWNANRHHSTTATVANYTIVVTLSAF